jgi:exopolysaccharide biosynthesis protein
MIKKITKNNKGIVLFLTVLIIFIVSLSAFFSAYLVKNRLFVGSEQFDSLKAVYASETGIEKVRFFSKTDSAFFDGCNVDDCIDFVNNNCTSCENPDSIALLYSGNLASYQVKAISVSTSTVSILSRGFYKSFEKRISASIDLTAE